MFSAPEPRGEDIEREAGVESGAVGLTLPTNLVEHLLPNPESPDRPLLPRY